MKTQPTLKSTPRSRKSRSSSKPAEGLTVDVEKQRLAYRDAFVIENEQDLEDAKEIERALMRLNRGIGIYAYGC